MNMDAFHVSFSGLGSAMPRVVEHVIREGVDRVPEGLRGKRLLFVADVHMSAVYPERAVRRLIWLIQSLAPDMVLWGGDFAESAGMQRRFVGMVSEIRPRLGMYGVVGNNDVEQMSAEALVGLWGMAGVGMLVNRVCRVEVEGGSLVLVGLDEPKYGRPELGVLRERRKEKEYRILMAHSPIALQEMPDELEEKVDLILCGHTHGGQCSILGWTPYSAGYEKAKGKKNFYVTGTHRVDGALMIVSNGVGTSRYPLRIGVPPQIHLITFPA